MIFRVAALGLALAATTAEREGWARADELLKAESFAEAAKAYLALVAANPKFEFADRALNNAAVCHENLREFDKAVDLYERIAREYPTSRLADSALFRVAINAEDANDFEKAVSAYQALLKAYPKSEDAEAALFNSGRLLEGLGRYGPAALEYLRYAERYPKSEDAPRAQYRAALIFEKLSEPSKELAALEAYLAKFGNAKGQAEFRVEARRRMGECHQRLAQDDRAKKAFAAAADEFDQRGFDPAEKPIAAAAAAIARFQLAEYRFREFDRLEISGFGPALEKSFAGKKRALKDASDAYDRVLKYRQSEWTQAASVRKEDLLSCFAQAIFDAPVPPEVTRLGEAAVAAYRARLENLAPALRGKPCVRDAGPAFPR